MTLNEKIKGIKRLMSLVFINEDITEDEKTKIMKSFKNIIERLESSSAN